MTPDSPIHDLVTIAGTDLNNYNYSWYTICRLEYVIRFLICICRFKLLLAVDEFNGCFGPTSFQLNKNEWVCVIAII